MQRQGWEACTGNLVDPEGMDVWSLNSNGFIVRERESEDDELYYKDKDGNLTERYITVGNSDILKALSNKNASNVSSYTSETGINDIFKVFKFAADNTNVEWVVHKNGDSYTLGTIHNPEKAGGWVDYGLEKPEASILPNSLHLYYVGYYGPQYIRNIGNYKRFYFGTLNNR